MRHTPFIILWSIKKLYLDDFSIRHSYLPLNLLLILTRFSYPYTYINKKEVNCDE